VLVVEPDLRGGGVDDGSSLAIVEVERFLGMGWRACSKHCGQTITPSLAMSCSLLISSFLPHFGHVQRISQVKVNSE
jgi:hypothetical protein